MTPSEAPPNRTIPRSRMLAAAIAAGIVAAICGVAVALAPSSGPVHDMRGISGALAVAAIVFVALFLLILFVLLLMEAGIAWRKRGGRPDPFTRDV